MHPVFARRIRFDLYLAAWLPVAALVTAALAVPSHRGLAESATIGVPLTLLAAFMSLAQWPMCRSLPLDRSHPLRLAVTHLGALLVSAGVWVAFGAGVAGVIGVMPWFVGALERYRLDVPYVTVIGALLFFSVTMLHYVLISLDDARAAERTALEAAVRGRDAELRALRAQIHPHFLFNGLNAIASLAGTDPPRARAMCVSLAEFFRATMALGSREEIPLAEELDLARRYLEIERVRFGDRLRLVTEADDDALACVVPSLLLQPLVENAVTHGVAHSIAGGVVRLAVRRECERLTITVENPAEPDRPPSRGQGIGITNVRARLAALHPGATRVECREAAGRFTVEVVLPAVERGPHGAAAPPDAVEVA
jgi:hypothetical protein